MDVLRFPQGVVALDIDAPTWYFTSGEGRRVMEGAVRELARRVSDKFGLGLFWLYHTWSGMHVLFENTVPDPIETMRWASEQQGWHECKGHLAHCISRGVTLRVGKKDVYPEYDIRPAACNPPVVGGHVEAHHRAVMGYRGE